MGLSKFLRRSGAAGGLLDDDDSLEVKKLVEEAAEFKPQELNEANVQAIFNRCLKTAETKEIEYTCLFRKEFGYEETEAPVHFDQEKIKANKQTIKYLFGQVQIVHCNEFSVMEEKAAARYDGAKWTANKGFLMMFLHFAGGAHIMGPFIADGQKASAIKLEPTLSPEDPAFPAWWEAYKGEWEDKA